MSYADWALVCWVLCQLGAAVSFGGWVMTCRFWVPWGHCSVGGCCARGAWRPQGARWVLNRCFQDCIRPFRQPTPPPFATAGTSPRRLLCPTSTCRAWTSLEGQHWGTPCQTTCCLCPQVRVRQLRWGGMDGQCWVRQSAARAIVWQGLSTACPVKALVPRAMHALH